MIKIAKFNYYKDMANIAYTIKKRHFNIQNEFGIPYNFNIAYNFLGSIHLNAPGRHLVYAGFEADEKGMIFRKDTIRIIIPAIDAINIVLGFISNLPTFEIENYKPLSISDRTGLHAV